MSEERERGAAKPQGCELPPPEGTGRPVAVADDARPHARLERSTPPPTDDTGCMRLRQSATRRRVSTFDCLVIVAVMAIAGEVLPVMHPKTTNHAAAPAKTSARWVLIIKRCTQTVLLANSPFFGRSKKPESDGEHHCAPSSRRKHLNLVCFFLDSHYCDTCDRGTHASLLREIARNTATMVHGKFTQLLLRFLGERLTTLGCGESGFESSSAVCVNHSAS